MPIKKVTTTAASVKPAKKTVSKKNSLPALVQASDSDSFWVTDGNILNSLVALRDALSKMSAKVYAHHVTKKGSDFAVWVEDVLNDPLCALELKKAKTAKAAHAIVVKYVAQYRV